MFTRFPRWLDRNMLSLGREMRLSYLPPLMVYMAYGISGLTGIVGTFFVKDYLDLSAAFLAALGFWAGIPWALKMPVGHIVDLIWRWKALLVWRGGALVRARGAAHADRLHDPGRGRRRDDRRGGAAGRRGWPPDRRGRAQGD